MNLKVFSNLNDSMIHLENRAVSSKSPEVYDCVVKFQTKMGIPSEQGPQIIYRKKKLSPGVVEVHGSARTQNKDKRTRNTGFTTHTDINFQSSL